VKRLLAMLVVVGLAAGLVGCTSSPTTGGVKPPTSTKPPPPPPTDRIKPAETMKVGETHKTDGTMRATEKATTKESKKD
jgi:hypothetical protein